MNWNDERTWDEAELTEEENEEVRQRIANKSVFGGEREEKNEEGA